jgi:hypothetical protein
MRFVLSDFPDWLRQSGDPVVRLILSEDFARLISSAIAPKQWHPFCRTLGIIHSDLTGTRLQVLQMSFRNPVRTSSPWQTQLADEAGIFKYTGPKSEDVYLSRAFPYAEALFEQKKTENPGMDVDELAQTFGLEISGTVRRWNDDLTSDPIALREDSCYDGDNGFWTLAALLLADWSEQFPVTGSDVNAFLASFDAGYDQDRRNEADVLRVSGLSRFGSKEIASLRQHIASLATPSQASANRRSFHL